MHGVLSVVRAVGPLLLLPALLRAQVLVGDRVRAAPGATVEFSLGLRSEAHAVSALQFELVLQETFTVAAGSGGQPACRVDPEIAKPASLFAFVPPDCDPHRVGDCQAVRALVFELGEQRPIPDGARVATCSLQVQLSAPPGRVAVALRDVVASSPEGQRLPQARGLDGELEIVVAPSPPASLPPSPLPSPTPTPTPTPSCRGDCNGDRSVTIEELLLLVLDALSGRADRCSAGDHDRSGTVTIEEIIRAVGSALEGCPDQLSERFVPVELGQ